MLDAPVVEINLHNVHEMSHLSEDEDAMVEFLEFGENPVQDLELTRRTPDPVMIADVLVAAQEHVRMVATLPQLHYQIVKGRIVHLPRVIGDQHCPLFR